MHTEILNNLSKKVFNKEIDSFKRIYGGMSNYNYLVKIDDDDYIFRIPLKSSNVTINRQHEYNNLLKLEGKEYMAKVFYFDVENGYKISEYIKGTSLNKLEEEQIPYQLVSHLLDDLHTRHSFNNNSNALDDLLRLEQLVNNQEADYYQIKEELLSFSSNLINQADHVACHCDCLPDNFVFGENKQLYLLDWEFSENSDPIYDIACFGENDFLQALKLFAIIYPNYSLNDLQRLYYWRIYQNLKWFNLALYKHNSGLSEELNFNFKEITHIFIDNSQALIREYHLITK